MSCAARRAALRAGSAPEERAPCSGALDAAVEAVDATVDALRAGSNGCSAMKYVIIVSASSRRLRYRTRISANARAGT